MGMNIMSQDDLRGSAEFLCRVIMDGCESDLEDERKRIAGRLLKMLCLQAGENSDIFRLASEIADSLDKVLELKCKVNKLCDDLRKKVGVWAD